MEKEIVKRFEEFEQAMVDKDQDRLTEIMTDDATLTHMSGKVQTREEYIGEIMDGTLNYFKYKLENVKVEINGDTAILTADNTLTARVYGISGIWTLDTHATFRRENNKWYYVGSTNTRSTN